MRPYLMTDLKKIVMIWAFMLTSLSVWAQDPVFSQFFASPLQLNPALSGTSEAPTIHLNYRNQWPLLSQAYATYAASYSQLAPKLNSGFGLSLMSDVAGNGIYNSTQIGFAYAYNLQFQKDLYLRMGLESNFVSKRLSWDKLIFLDQLNVETGAFDANGNINPTFETQPNLNINYFDFGFGALFYSKYVYGGFALKHINSPREAFIRPNAQYDELPMRISFHAGGQIPLSKNNKYKTATFISPNILFTKQRQFKQLNIGSYIQHESFFGGIWFRHTFTNSDAVILMAGYEMNLLKIAYSYDLTVSNLGINSGGAHEISLIFNFKTKNKGTNYNDCLNLFR